MFEIVAGQTRREDVLILFAEYFATLVDAGLAAVLATQNPEAELSDLDSVYAAPTGGLWLALHDGAPVGCVAVKRNNDVHGELKRLYVRPAGRGHGLGSLLLETAITGARDLGYRRLRLDTAPHMTAAIGLYERHGFYRVGAYNDNPAADAVFMELAL
ncbi:GNAT family N-acetyltransferase [Corynebacterium guangdongense]|uniref:Ribosomal protein S18 acetylase RimI-like enzyme n=1 Tax=Corynebacterium guangdongense TaxID=1783348 RepID=A0ABU1ZYB9_9CORY|nr:GNAT family N-acetyltransferase [Corynebacterium guangdongense]MDR7328878.1 ribosomal protein S18 acetylase RimI-like enzyme [Corynebacterium guangdongense]WJZ17453.1 N-acetylglutamate synthase [Corynebacterium guangdongense]